MRGYTCIWRRERFLEANMGTFNWLEKKERDTPLGERSLGEGIEMGSTLKDVREISILYNNDTNN